ncbi:MAG: FAD-dependent oxidoreductase, partial [Lachnospiraceae bacterium]|nr:FAD-dependent oxidoreductase [Lachnospiraceae bacterium]
LSISLAAKLSKEFDGKLRIAYSGGADYYNIERIVAAGIWPVTVATTLLKPGGYQRFTQMAKCLEDTAFKAFAGIDLDAVEQLAKDAKTDKHHRKCAKELPSRKMKQEVPLLDCFIAPCEEGCPIHQDVTNYIALAGEGKYKEALQVILDKNPLPFITGTICAHNCMTKCTRNFYDEPVNIRGTKLIAAQGGYDSVIKDIQPTTDKRNKKVAVVGGGPTGIAAAYFLLRAGAEVTIFEKTNALGGVVRHTIPSFRITGDAIDKDISLIEKMGADIRTNVEIGSIEELKAKGYEDIVVAVGASIPGTLQLETGDTLNALDFLAEFKAKDGNLNLGKNVVVVGGGNTAMDTARAAKRTKGVEHVYLVYRRTKRYMPADEEELVMALEDGVIFKDLLSPLSLENGKLRCRKMELSEERDTSGRRGIIETQVIETVDADTVIVAVGEKVPTQYYKSNTFAVDEKGKVIVNCETCETSLTGVYVVGDGLGGPATVVEGIRDAMKAASAIVAGLVITDIKPEGTVDGCYAKKGILISEEAADNESERCLKCNTICENCVEVCPNRANISIKVTGMDMPQIIHVDYMCNECGNCKSFCPYTSAPYKDKFTLFASEEHMNDSKNDGFVVLNQETMECRVRLLGKETICKCKDAESEIHKGLRNLMQSVIEDYRYLIMK